MPHGRRLPNTIRPASLLRATVTAVVDATLVEEVIRTPVDPGDNIALLLWGYDVSIQQLETPDTAIGAAPVDVETSANVVLSTRQNAAAIPLLSDGGTILTANRLMASWADEGAVGAAGGLTESHVGLGHTALAAPILIADPRLSLYAITSGQPSPLQMQVVLYYELVQVSSQEFFAALSLMESLGN